EELPGEDDRPNARVFRVTRPPGFVRDVTVVVDPEAIAAVERLAKRDLGPSSGFWTSLARRALAEWLWNDGRAPSGPIVISDVDGDDLRIAERWKDAD